MLSLTDWGSIVGVRAGYRLLVLLGAAFALFSYNSAAAANSCTEKYRPVLDRALNDNDIASLSSFVNDKDIQSECPMAWHDSIRIKATQVVANEAERLVLAGDILGAEQLLSGDAPANFALASYWSLNAVLGDIARKRLHWQHAAQQYGEAYELAVADTTLESLGDDRARQIQLELFRLASESLRLGKDLSVAISRSGAGSGTLSSRGFKPMAIPLPVTFEFDSSTLSQQGLEQANLIANYIARQNLEHITLTGHTDWKGCAAYNQQLSEQRANTLAAAVNEAIKTLGETSGANAVKINSQGFGESCPPVLSASGEYSAEQHENLARRVEIVLGDGRAGVDAASCDLEQVKQDASNC